MNGDLRARAYQEADGALLEVPSGGGGVVGARVAGRELGLEDQLAQLLLVDVLVLVEPLRAREPLLHPGLAPPAYPVPHRSPDPPPPPPLQPPPETKPLLGRCPPPPHCARAPPPESP